MMFSTVVMVLNMASWDWLWGFCRGTWPPPCRDRLDPYDPLVNGHDLVRVLAALGRIFAHESASQLPPE